MVLKGPLEIDLRWRCKNQHENHYNEDYGPGTSAIISKVIKIRPGIILLVLPFPLSNDAPAQKKKQKQQCSAA